MEPPDMPCEPPGGLEAMGRASYGLRAVKEGQAVAATTCSRSFWLFTSSALLAFHFSINSFSCRSHSVQNNAHSVQNNAHSVQNNAAVTLARANEQPSVSATLSEQPSRLSNVHFTSRFSSTKVFRACGRALIGSEAAAQPLGQLRAMSSSSRSLLRKSVDVINCDGVRCKGAHAGSSRDRREPKLIHSVLRTYPCSY
eukprot:6171915-Pleurochrysis_carterae.AAC.6